MLPSQNVRRPSRRQADNDPGGSPHLGVVEECRSVGKPVVFRGMVYRRISELRHAISESRTVSFARPCTHKYIYRSTVKALNYL